MTGAVMAWELLCGAQQPELIIDIREPEAHARGHLPGARCLPYGRFQAEALALSRGAGPLLVVDAAGARAAEMATWLCARGRPAAWLEGGMAAWAGPLERT
jgi:rhodanese-related sulfurtransferase